MVPSSALCRTQEALHRRRAADTSLANVRLVSNDAAAAWAKEATAAEVREARQLRVRASASDDGAEIPSLSENPDRGLTHP